MKAIITIIFLILNVSIYSQIQILSIDNTNSNDCTGSIALLSLDVGFEFTLQGPNQNLNYQFSEANLTIEDLCEGSYTIIFHDSFACEMKIEFSISTCVQLEITENVNYACGDDNNGIIEITVPNDGNFYDIIWSNGVQGKLIDKLQAGQYSVTITDQNDCKTIKTYTIEKVTSPEILLKKMKGLDGIGDIVIDVQGGVSPYSIEWLDPLNIITETSQDEMSVKVNNANQINTELAVKVIDSNGCSAYKNIKIDGCTNQNDFEFHLDLLNSSDCSEANNLPIIINGFAEFVSYQISHVSNGMTSLSLGSSEVYDNGGVKYINLNINETGLYTITLTNECGKSETKQRILECECDYSIPPLLEIDIDECGLTDDSKIFLIQYQGDIEYICAGINIYSNSGICALEYPWIYRIKFPDNSEFDVSADINGAITWETVKPSTKINPENDDFEYEINNKGLYKFKITNGLGCTRNLSKNYDFIPEYPILGAGFIDVLQMKAQGINFSCKSCVDPVYPSSYFVENLGEYCNSGTLGWSYFDWGPFDLESPFSKGGAYNVVGAGQVVIPSGTPFVEVLLGTGFDSNCRGALFPWEYAAGPVYQGYPIFVLYCPESQWNDDQSDCLIDCDCENEWPESIGGCNFEVSCLDDPDNPVILGIIPNTTEITPCQAWINSQCQIVGLCLETNELYQHENGDYYYYNEYDCSNLDIPYCIDVQNGTSEPYNPNCGEPCVIFQSQPNPVYNQADITIPFCIGISDFPELLIYDNPGCTGTPVYSMFSDYTVAGYSSFEIPGGTLPNSTLYYKLEINGYCTSQVKTMLIVSLTGNDEAAETRVDKDTTDMKFNLEISREQTFKVFPNPNGGIFTILNESKSRINSISLYDINGRQMQISKSFEGDTIKVGTYSHKPGIYILEIISSESKEIHKIVFQ